MFIFFLNLGLDSLFWVYFFAKNIFQKLRISFLRVVLVWMMIRIPHISIILNSIWLRYMGAITGVMSCKPTFMTYDGLFTLFGIMTSSLTIKASFWFGFILLIFYFKVFLNPRTILFLMAICLTLKAFWRFFTLFCIMPWFKTI